MTLEEAMLQAKKDSVSAHGRFVVYCVNRRSFNVFGYSRPGYSVPTEDTEGAAVNELGAYCDGKWSDM